MTGYFAVLNGLTNRSIIIFTKHKAIYLWIQYLKYKSIFDYCSIYVLILFLMLSSRYKIIEGSRFLSETSISQY